MPVNFFAMEKTLQIGQNNTIISTTHETKSSRSDDTTESLNMIDTGNIYIENDKHFRRNSESPSNFAQSKIIE